MPEIIIRNPILNPDELFRSYSYDTKEIREGMSEFLARKITKESHPKAIDLCAGDGSYARILVDNGWKGQNMTCVDRFRTRTPLVKDAVWRYWDLEQMAHELQLRQPMPEEITLLKGSFDIAFFWFSRFIKKEDRLLVCRYLVRPDGYISTL